MIFFGGIRNFLRGVGRSGDGKQIAEAGRDGSLPLGAQLCEKALRAGAVDFDYPSGPGGGGSDSSNSFKFSLLTTAVPVSMREGSG